MNYLYNSKFHIQFNCFNNCSNTFNNQSSLFYLISYFLKDIHRHTELIWLRKLLYNEIYNEILCCRKICKISPGIYSLVFLQVIIPVHSFIFNAEYS